ncbi:LADA_0G12904g1_1 [Lachancea dasiensis]|uniref:LADA_0G12904g1_1 n=1 Tax=Lachancea dasiensis TaxID=1072105 RepID=A0A1G4JVE8_9SACH|nr:LADA_0G12904g1_1 [Lachancea dasiensis]
MKLTKLFGLSIASLAMNAEFAQAKWPDQSLYRVADFVTNTPKTASWNATTECQDETLSMFNSALSFKVNMDLLEHYVLEFFSVFRTLLKGKNEFCALDLMDIATEQLHWIPPAGLDLSKISMTTQFSKMKTIYYSAPVLRHSHRWFAHVVEFSSQNSHWKTAWAEAKQKWILLQSSNPTVRGLAQEMGRLLQDSDTLKVMANLKNDWTRAPPTCQKPQEVHITKKPAPVFAAAAAAAPLNYTPSRAIEIIGPTPGNLPQRQVQNVTAVNVTQANNSNQNATVIAKGDESVGSTSSRFSSWSVFGAVIVVLSGTVLF